MEKCRRRRVKEQVREGEEEKGSGARAGKAEVKSNLKRGRGEESWGVEVRGC